MEPINQAMREGDGMLARNQASRALVRDLRGLLMACDPGAGRRSRAARGAHGPQMQASECPRLPCVSLQIKMHFLRRVAES